MATALPPDRHTTHWLGGAEEAQSGEAAMGGERKGGL
jgi:hypothetical protein